jgi:hypothetical protein
LAKVHPKNWSVTQLKKGQETMMIKILKKLLVFSGGVILLAGCATNQGGVGNDTESTRPQAISGPNGSVGPGNPLGIGGASTTAGGHSD